VTPRAADPALDGLEPELRDRDWYFVRNHVVIALLGEVVADFGGVLRIRATADEARAFETTDDIFDDPRSRAGIRGLVASTGA
jgi:DNA mismatch repair protein MutH